jgi:hypothetical protein
VASRTIIRYDIRLWFPGYRSIDIATIWIESAIAKSLFQNRDFLLCFFLLLVLLFFFFFLLVFFVVWVVWIVWIDCLFVCLFVWVVCLLICLLIFVCLLVIWIVFVRSFVRLFGL